MIINDIKQWQNAGKKIVLYCAGLHGIEFKKILKLMDITVDFFCDNDEGKNGKIIDGVMCRKPQEFAHNSNYCFIICAGMEKYVTIYDQAVRQGLENIIDFRLILDSIVGDKVFLSRVLFGRYRSVQADLFYTNFEKINIEKRSNKKLEAERIAIYTSSFGNYDNLYSPIYRSDNADYYYVSDIEPDKLSGFRWIDAKKYMPDMIGSPIKRNRYIKMHPDKLFPEYKYSIYVDGNIQIVGDVTQFICESKSGISVFRHWRRDCIYYEAATIVNHKRAVPEDVIAQMSRYIDEGMPLHYGLTEMPVIAREHHNDICRQVMRAWWQEFNAGAQRDQLSFMYALWKNGLKMNDLAILGDNVRNHPLLKFYNHKQDSQYVKNERP